MGSFGQRLQQALALRGISQAELARLSGVPQGSISRYIAGDRDMARAWALAQALGVSADWLAKGDGPMINAHGGFADPTAALMNFAERLKGARRDAGFDTPANAAKASGIEAPRWAGFEAARFWPDCDELIQIMRALGVSLDYLVGGVLPAPGQIAQPPPKAQLHEGFKKAP